MNNKKSPFNQLRSMKKALLPIAMAPFFLVGCSGDDGAQGEQGPAGSDGISPTPFPTPTPEPTSSPLPLTSKTINLSGGAGSESGGNGGNGGGIYIEKETLSGDTLFTEFEPDPPAYTPQTFTPNLGDNPMNITSDTTVTNAVVEPVAGVYYSSGGRIYLSDGDTIFAESEELVTGVSVQNGATLTFDGVDGGEGAPDIRTVILLGDLHVAGTVDLSGSIRELRLFSSAFLGESTGLIDVSTGFGQMIGGLTIGSNNALINAATLRAGGADAGVSGPGVGGGTIDLSANTYLQNDGGIFAEGGDGLGAFNTGGAGGRVSFISNNSIYSTGEISVDGGDGEYRGGMGGQIGFESFDNRGIIYQAGALSISGGSGLNSSLGFGDGAEGGTLDVETRGVDVYLAGSYDARGGSGVTATGRGGDGGDILIEMNGGEGGIAPSNITFAGSIDLSGGDAVIDGTDSGGQGGYIEVEIDGANDVLLEFVAATINLAGGDGNDGGEGGDLYLSHSDPRFSSTVDALGSSADVHIGSAINASGGNSLETSSEGTGGYAGELTFDTGSRLRQETRALSVSGDITAQGGTGFQQDGDDGASNGGYLYLNSSDAMTITSLINLDGGDDLGTVAGYGGSAGGIEIMSDSVIYIDADFSLQGGAGDTQGGGGGTYYVSAETLTHTGDVNAAGGDATDSGGEGGQISADVGLPATFDGVISVEGGAGTTAGEAGGVRDGLNCTGNCDGGGVGP